MRKMGIGENYVGKLTPMRSNISRFSRGTVGQRPQVPSAGNGNEGFLTVFKAGSKRSPHPTGSVGKCWSGTSPVTELRGSHELCAGQLGMRSQSARPR